MFHGIQPSAWGAGGHTHTHTNLKKGKLNSPDSLSVLHAATTATWKREVKFDLQKIVWSAIEQERIRQVGRKDFILL
jgi:hypothetical protein